MIKVIRKQGRRGFVTEEMLDNMVLDYNNGMTQREVAEKYGVSVETVKNHFKKRR